MPKEQDESSKPFDFSDGNWGIFRNVNNIPHERWDSFRTILDKYGTKIGHSSLISPLRANRPFEVSLNNNSSFFLKKDVYNEEDTFCQLVKGELPAIVIIKDEEVSNNLKSTDYKFEDLRNSTALTIINLFPPVGRVVNQNEANNSTKLFSTGYALVHLTTKHYSQLEAIPTEELEIFLRNIKKSHELIEELHTQNQESMSIIHFWNIGSKSGASIPHIHSQSYINTSKKGHGWKVQGFLVAFEESKRYINNPEYCLGCEYKKNPETDIFGQKLLIESRKIYENRNWLLVAEYAPERDAHLRILPKRHISRFNQCNTVEIADLAQILILANLTLTSFVKKKGKNLFMLQDRNILFRQQFFGYSSNPHMLIDILPVQQVGGVEIYDEYRICHIYPEETAEIMRELIDKNENGI